MTDDATEMPNEGDRIELVYAKREPPWLDEGDRGTVTNVTNFRILYPGSRDANVFKVNVEWDVGAEHEVYTLFSNEDEWTQVAE